MPLPRSSSAKFHQKKSIKKSAAPPISPTFLNLIATHFSINTTLAGVAQSVERVALITAKRSTSRSWVRAPPSAIPISKLIRAAVLLLFVCLLIWIGPKKGCEGGWAAKSMDVALVCDVLLAA
jgi:hypothetical protein